MKSPYDVVICGGGLAGLTLSLQLRRELPELNVAVLERSRRPLPSAAFKIGESAVELGSMYLEDLGLLDNLREHHIVKLGLRFFPGGGDLPLHERAELGPSEEPRVVSYQIDRGRFENDLREIVQDRGVTLLEGAKVTDVEWGEGDASHTVSYELDGESQRVTTRWVADATGRSAFLKKKLKLSRGSAHTASSGWFRMRGRVGLTRMVPPEHTAWHEIPLADQRWRSTNHMMGEGYWLWLIPLAGDVTSVGMVVHDHVHGFDNVRTLEGLQEFIAQVEPHVAEHLEDAEVLDFMCLRRFSHGISRSWSAERWAVVGVAGAFLDPLYSNGTDFIGLANSLATEVIRADFEGGDVAARAMEMNLQYKALVSGSLDIFLKAAPIYAHARAMAAKIHWDNFCYWSFPCQYYRQGIYRLSGDAHAAFSEGAMRFVDLSGYVQSFLSEWATMAPEQPAAGFIGLPQWPSLQIDAHLALMDDMSPDETLAYMQSRAAEGEEMVAELLLRVLQELGPERGASLLERVGYAKWNLRLTPERRAAEVTRGRERRRALSAPALDVVRNLGEGRKHVRADEAMALLRS